MNTGSDSHPLLQLCLLTGHRMSSDDISGLSGDMNWAICCYADRLLRSVHVIVFKNKRAYKLEGKLLLHTTCGPWKTWIPGTTLQDFIRPMCILQIT